MHAANWLANRFATRPVILAGAVSLCLVVAGCGNKGDLFLDPEELTDEQKALLGQLGTDEASPGTDGTLKSDDDDAEKKKKKVSDPKLETTTPTQ